MDTVSDNLRSDLVTLIASLSLYVQTIISDVWQCPLPYVKHDVLVSLNFHSFYISDEFHWVNVWFQLKWNS